MLRSEDHVTDIDIKTNQPMETNHALNIHK